MIERYSRQISFKEIGEKGQERLGSTFVVIIGCGGLGSIIATSLVRAGIGKVKIIDRDFLEWHNLHRQIIYNEDDVYSHLPKAVVAEQHLKKVNSSVKIEGIVADVTPNNIEGLLKGADLVLDASDNFETRFIINDTCLKYKIPWVYGGVVGSWGMTMNIIPERSPCLRCVYPKLPNRNPVTEPERVGIIGSVPIIIGSLQTIEAMKILIGADGINRDLIITDVWKGTWHRIKIKPWNDCPSCQGKFEFLNKTTL